MLNQYEKIDVFLHFLMNILHLYSCDGCKIIGEETCLCGEKNINEVYSLENKETHQFFHIG